MKKSRHSQTTLPHTLGELELAVMDSVWTSSGGAADAKQILDRISRQHPSSLSTIQSTLERLVRKNMLEREKQGHAFLYTAIVSRAELLGLLLKDVIRLLHDGSPDTILSSFVNVASRIDTSALDHLERLIKQKRRQMEDDDHDD
jgi:predicted transcriptional regulator